MKVNHIEEKEKFELISEDGKIAGEIDYRTANAHLVYATHTEVFEGYDGKGYAGILLDALVDWARAKEMKIYPTCPYVDKMFEKYPEKYGDINGKK